MYPNTTKKPYFLQFYTPGNGTEWLDYGLPQPHYLHHAVYGYMIAWMIDGYFATETARRFLIDIIGRYLLAFPGAQRLPYAPYIEERRESAHTLDAPPVTLKQFSRALPSLPKPNDEKRRNAEFWAAMSKKERQDDALFEATRWHLYRRAYAEGTGKNIEYDYVLALLEAENGLLERPRSPSDVRAKAKAMSKFMQEEFVVYEHAKGYNEWSNDKKAAYYREYYQTKIKTGGEMSREEAGRRASKIRQDRKIQAIKDAMNSVLSDSLKKKNGQWNATAIAEIAGVDPRTVRKYLKEIESEDVDFFDLDD